jgi:putative methyltransferase (TIGR01177 family)
MRDLDTPQPLRHSRPPSLPPSSLPGDPAVLVWLWGQETELALAEVATLSGLSGGTAGGRRAGTPPVVVGPHLVAARVEDWHVLERLGFGRAVLRCLGWSAAPRPPFDPRDVVRGSFAVKVHRLHAVGAMLTEVSAAEVALPIWRRLRHPRVDLRHPDTELHVFVTPGGCWWGQLMHRFDQRIFEARHPRRRPFWRSVALSPRQARCLVNLSAVHPGGRLLDPFCGTASIPIEAALLGVQAHGADLDPVVVAGASRNAAHVGVEVALSWRDARSWGAADGCFEAIVSDLPHGRTASLHGAEREQLYRTFLAVALERLVMDGRAVLMVQAGTLPAPPPGLVVLGRYYEVVHGSLTREVAVLQKTAPLAGASA